MGSREKINVQYFIRKSSNFLPLILQFGSRHLFQVSSILVKSDQDKKMEMYVRLFFCVYLPWPWSLTKPITNFTNIHYLGKFKASLSQLNMNTAMLWTMLLDGSLLIRGAPHTGFPAVNIYTTFIKTRLENLRCQNKTAKSAF